MAATTAASQPAGGRDDYIQNPREPGYMYIPYPPAGRGVIPKPV